MPDTLKVFGDEYPIIKSFEDGWHLVMHPNGPAIGKSFGNPDGGLLASLEHSHDDVPESIRTKAIAAYIEYTRK